MRSRLLRLGVDGLSRRLLNLASPSWSNVDARLAKAMLYGGAARSAEPPLLGSPGSVLLVSKIKVSFG